MPQAVEELVAVEEGNMVLEDDLGEELISALVGDWRLLYTSSSAIEYNQARCARGRGVVEEGIRTIMSGWPKIAYGPRFIDGFLGSLYVFNHKMCLGGCKVGSAVLVSLPQWKRRASARRR